MNYDRLILELMDRVSQLEEEVADLKQYISSGNLSKVPIPVETSSFYSNIYSSRDTTKYILDGKRYGKNRLVLAVIQKYIKTHPEITAYNLIATFDKSLQGSLGVVRKLEDVIISYADYERRFFCNENEIINTSTDDCVVCTQWGKFNIDNFIVRAKQLGIEIEEI